MKLSKDQILQISNDILEDDCSATKTELIEVCRYWIHAHHDKTMELANWKLDAGLAAIKKLKGE